MGIRKVSIRNAENGIKVNKMLQNYRDILFLSFCTHCGNLKGTGSVRNKFWCLEKWSYRYAIILSAKFVVLYDF